MKNAPLPKKFGSDRIRVEIVVMRDDEDKARKAILASPSIGSLISETPDRDRAYTTFLVTATTGSDARWAVYNGAMLDFVQAVVVK